MEHTGHYTVLLKEYATIGDDVNVSMFTFGLFRNEMAARVAAREWEEEARASEKGIVTTATAVPIWDQPSNG